MPSPPDLPAALAEHAATHPRDPWLFYPEGLDWRWISYEEARPGLLPPARGGTEGGLPPACAGIEGVLADASAQAGLVAAADRIAACLPPTTAGWAGRRDIVVLSPPWDEPAARSMLAWAVVTGAAVVLEPDPARRVGTAAWARPTVFHGSAAEVGALCRAAARAAGRRWWRTRRPRLLSDACAPRCSPETTSRSPPIASG